MVSHDSTSLLGAREEFISLGKSLLLPEKRPLLEERCYVDVLDACRPQRRRERPAPGCQVGCQHTFWYVLALCASNVIRWEPVEGVTIRFDYCGVILALGKL